MASIYDAVKTAKDLLIEVRIHGLSTKPEDICRAQDIFGHSTEEELAALANDNGRRNDNGEPDPLGSWSSGEEGYGSTFYMVLFNIWNWREAVAFYNKHSNFELLRKEAELQSLKREAIDLREENSKLVESIDSKKSTEAEMFADKMEALSELQDAKDEILRLKARLYDLLCGCGKENA